MGVERRAARGMDRASEIAQLYFSSGQHGVSVRVVRSGHGIWAMDGRGGAGVMVALHRPLRRGRRGGSGGLRRGLHNVLQSPLCASNSPSSAVPCPGYGSWEQQ